MRYRVTFYERGIPRMIINGAEVSNKITRRLAAYEDTGLDPEEVAQLQERAAADAEELREAKAELDSILQLPNCNSCVGCKHQPPINGAIVLNCPLYASAVNERT